MTIRFWFSFFLVLALSPLLLKADGNLPDTASPALKNAVILVIRHAEKPESGFALSAAGNTRAKLYVKYFQNFTVGSRPLKIDHIFATADSSGSHRPRLTVEPLGHALDLPIDNRFKDNQFQALAHEIRSRSHGRNILICWHHGEIPNLVRALGAEPEKLFPHSVWPEHVFCWVIELRYDEKGRLAEARRINEDLMPDDSESDKE